MPRRSDRIPPLKRHKATGQGYALVSGHRYYLGRHGLPETRERYDRFVQEWLANGRDVPVVTDEVTVTELLARYWRHAEKYYRLEDGSPSSEINCLRLALRPLPHRMPGRQARYPDRSRAASAARGKAFRRGRSGR